MLNLVILKNTPSLMLMPMLLTDRVWTSKKSREEGEPMIFGSRCVISGYTVTTLVDVLDAKTFNKGFSDP